MRLWYQPVERIAVHCMSARGTSSGHVKPSMMMTTMMMMMICVDAVACNLVDEDDTLTLLPAVVQARMPQSPPGQTVDLTRDVGSRDLGSGRDVMCTGSGSRKTVRFADESATSSSSSSTLDAGERPLNDGDRPPAAADVGYTLRPHYPTRVCLSTFHSNSPTIAPSEL